MHTETLYKWQHNHDFAVKNKRGEQRTKYILILTAITMVIEIIAGTIYGSMALLADGWHMSTHVAAFLIAIYAYQHSRKHTDNPEYTFGTGKVNVLGGFASAIALAVVAVVMLIESIQRIISPHEIHFFESIVVAGAGLFINLVSAILLKENHDQDHDHENEHHGHHHDYNLRAAYLHVVADAMTSVLAIAALVSGKYLGWYWLDPVMGIVGAVVIIRWSYGLLKQTSPILLDASIGDEYKAAIKEAIERDSDNRISDIHLWDVGANHYSTIISLVTHFPKTADHYKELLTGFQELTHISVEINECRDEPCIIPENYL